MLETTAGQYLMCYALSLCVSCCLSTEMSAWSHLFVQYATYCKLRGKVHEHAMMCVFVRLFAFAVGLLLQMCSGNSSALLQLIKLNVSS